MIYDYKTIIHAFVDEIINKGSNFDIQIKEDEKNINIDIDAESQIMSRLIGKKGVTANALREVMSIIGRENNKFVHIYYNRNQKENII